MRIYERKLRNMAHALSLSVFIALKGTYLMFLFSSTGLSYRCGGVLTDATGWLSFTVNNNLYPFNMICHWTIIAPSDKRIVLTILNMNPDENEPVWYCKWNAVVAVSYHINIHSMPQLTQHVSKYYFSETV